ncbi:MAG: hypothetical protein H7X97_05230 [Opitutaceae bacterium]|nr:hypothetical protein [Verrucomicrobiales bacterium]
MGGKLNDHLTLGFTRSKAATDVSFNVEVTSGLTGPWQSGPGFTELMSTTDLGAMESLLYRDVQTIGGNPKRFIRLKVTRP